MRQMPDNTRLPRIGEIWESKEFKDNVLVMRVGKYFGVGKYFVTIMYDDFSMSPPICLEDFICEWEPTGDEYDLDPLILALKGDRT